MSDLFSLPVYEIAKKIKDGKLTSVEICKHYIDRINKFEKDIKDTRLKHVYLNEKGLKIFDEIFFIQKKRFNK